MSRDLVLGLDGGGSKTVAALADRDGTVMTLRHGGALDPFGNPQWRSDLAAIVRGFDGTAGELQRVVLGLSCHTEIETVSAEQRGFAETLFAAPVDVLNDVHVAFEGALAGRPGVLSLAGTGSMAWAGDGRGLHRRTGGWGDLIGDEGSSYWVGREALAETSRALDGRTDNAAFAKSILDHLAIRAGDLIGWVYGLRNRRTTVAALAMAVDARAEAGDPAALTLMRAAADHLCVQVETAWRLVDVPGSLVWSHAGGLFNSLTVQRRARERLGPPIEPELPPVGGALLEAAKRAGWTTDRAWRASLAASLAHAFRPGGVPAQSMEGCTA